MAVADFSLPKYIDQDNTQLIPDAMAKGAAAGAHIAQAIQGARQIQQAQSRLLVLQQEEQRKQAEDAIKARSEAMKFQGYQSFARDKEVFSQLGMTEEQAHGKALLKNITLMSGGDPKNLMTLMDKNTDNIHAAQVLDVRQKHQAIEDDLRGKKIEADERAHKATEALRDTEEKNRNQRFYFGEGEKRVRAEEDRVFKERQGDTKYANEFGLLGAKQAGEGVLEDKRQTNREKLENLRQKDRLDLNKLRTQSKTIVDRLPTNHRLAMQAELKAAESLEDDKKGEEIDRINAKYNALRLGRTGVLGGAMGIDAPLPLIRRDLVGSDAAPVEAKTRLGGAAPELREDTTTVPVPVPVPVPAPKLPATTRTASPNEIIDVIDPTGRPGRMSRANFERAKKANKGYKEAK